MDKVKVFTLRERAEKVFRGIFKLKANGLSYDTNDIEDIQNIESAFREVRREALDEAAKEAEATTIFLSCSKNGHSIADKIRALAEKESSE